MLIVVASIQITDLFFPAMNQGGGRSKDLLDILI